MTDNHVMHTKDGVAILQMETTMAVLGDGKRSVEKYSRLVAPQNPPSLQLRKFFGASPHNTLRNACCESRKHRPVTYTSKPSDRESCAS